MTRLKYSDAIARLTELVESEHTCGCDQSTCSISASFNAGYALWSIHEFASSGAASDEYSHIFDGLPKRFKKDAELERKAFVKDVEHAECPHCNAIVWDPQWVTNRGMVFL